MLNMRFPKKQFSRFREFVGPVNSKTFQVAASKYLYFVAARDLLPAIATVQQGRLVMPPSLGWEAIVHLELDSQGKVQLFPTKLLSPFLGVEAMRVRVCPLCDRIFWAGRSDQPACSKKCAHTLRTRRWREGYAIYKMQRYRKAEQSQPTIKWLLGVRPKRSGKKQQRKGA
jgi:hypothetical protein